MKEFNNLEYFYNLVKEKYGSIVTRKQVNLLKDEIGFVIPGAFWACKTNVRGQYDIEKLHEAAGVKEKATVLNHSALPEQEPKLTVIKNIQENVIQEDYSEYIPQKDETFVPHGDNYQVLNKIISANMFFPVYLYGISGIGKTSAISDICAKTKTPLFRAQITKETTDEDLIGSWKLESGDTVWQDGPVLKAYRSGGVLLLDEIDMNNTLMILQPILENKPFYIKQTGELVHPAPGFTVTATGNTKGDGDFSAGVFVGATVLNEAFKDRFALILKQEIPSIETEKRIMNIFCKTWKLDISDVIKTALLEWIDASRKSYESGHMEVYISTRRIGYILKNMSLVSNPNKAIEMVLSRFDEEHAAALLLLWRSVYSETKKLATEEIIDVQVNKNEYEPF